MRGKRYTSGGGTQPARITPAGAGKTGTKKSPTLARKDHPRRCGENSILLKLHVAGEGSPPQVRGKPRNQRQCSNRDRITPADAGKTKQIFVNRVLIEDHPRGCGENAKKIL